MVKLLVTIKDASGQPVAGLTPNDFTVFEDGVKQKVESLVPADNEPLMVGLLVDGSGTRIGQLPGAEHKPALEFLRREIRPNDIAFVARFADEAELFGRPTNELPSLEKSLAQAMGLGPRGASALYDSIVVLCEKVFAQRNGRKILVSATDGVDNASKAKLEKAIEAANRAEVTIYIVHLPTPDTSRPYRGRKSAAALAEQTGGRVIFGENAAAVADAFRQISNELRCQYTLGYYPTNTTRDGKFRKLEVETTRKDLKVLTRKGYYAPKG